MARWDGCGNAVAIGNGIGRLDHRRHQIGHDDRTGKMLGRLANHTFQHLAITQMQMPVIGTAKVTRLVDIGRSPGKQ